MNDYWCIPPKENAEFVANMEDILDIYEMPYNPQLPVVCMDEKPYQCLGETREPLPMRPGDDQKIDSEYVREGTCSIFIFTEPLRGWLNIAEIELNVMTRQCLARRLDCIAKIQQELKAWERMRNEECGKVLWHFTTPQARTKLLSLYPKFESSGD